MRVSNELERIADMCKGISKRVIRMVESGSYRYPPALVQMAEAALSMLRDVLVAFSNEDIKLCLEVRRADTYVDNLNREVVAWTRAWIEQDVEKSGAAIELLAIGQRVERLADIVTAIAEDTVFLVEGRLVRHGAE
jgi:phosphate transport system protein